MCVGAGLVALGHRFPVAGGRTLELSDASCSDALSDSTAERWGRMAGNLGIWGPESERPQVARRVGEEACTQSRGLISSGGGGRTLLRAGEGRKCRTLLQATLRGLADTQFHPDDVSANALLNYGVLHVGTKHGTSC